jgi:hypothetical protein
VITQVGTRGKRKRSLKRTLLYAAIPTILAFLIIEGCFRVYELVCPDDPLAREYRQLANNPACASKPWFSQDFVASWSMDRPWHDPDAKTPRRFYTPEGTGLRLPHDYQDRFITIRNGMRATTGFDPASLESGRRARKLMVFGGSTTFCLEVPDEFTWASQLQKELAAIPQTRDIEVINCGVGSAVSVQEVGRLEYEIGRNNIPDFCVFFDGINDTGQGVCNGNPALTMTETAQNYNNATLIGTLKQIARLSCAARTIYHSLVESQKRNDRARRPEAMERELARATAEGYERNMLRAKEICGRHGIRMFVFLQPHLFSIARPWTAHEQTAATSIRKSDAEGLRVCYPFLREKLSRLKQRGIKAYDISDAFDANLEPIFVDEYHVESTGNRLIAQAILKHALPFLRASSSPLAVAPPGQPDYTTAR